MTVILMNSILASRLPGHIMSEKAPNRWMAANQQYDNKTMARAWPGPTASRCSTRDSCRYPLSRNAIVGPEYITLCLTVLRPAHSLFECRVASQVDLCFDGGQSNVDVEGVGEGLGDVSASAAQEGRLRSRHSHLLRLSISRIRCRREMPDAETMIKCPQIKEFLWKDLLTS